MLTRKRLAYIFGIFALLGCTIWCGVSFALWQNSYVQCFETPFPTHFDVETNGLFKFPDSARNVEFNAQPGSKGGGCTIWAKFEMDRAEINTFVETTLVNVLTPSTHLPHVFEYGSQRETWNLPNNGLAGHSIRQTVDFPDQQIFVDTTNPQTFIVYLTTSNPLILRD